jgi:LEA14-like dessication related protein
MLRWWRIGGGLLLTGCTPLGLWIYQDPAITVSRVSLQLVEVGSANSSPVIVGLAVENRNDYPLSTERVELALRMDGIPIGRLAHDRPLPVAMDTISTVAIPLILDKETTPAKLRAFSSGTHLFAVRGKATFRTPIGRREVHFAQEGSMAFGIRGSRSSP